MNKQKALKVVNILLAVFALNQTVTALLSGVLSHSVFEIMHKPGGFALSILAIVHVYLNWGWVRTSLLGKPFKKN